MIAGQNWSVDYVVVAYRSARHLDACLDAIVADHAQDGRIIVVDNDSLDESAAIANAHPAAPFVITSPVNVGFGAACNLAARESTADLLFFVNPDARLRAGATRRLIDALVASLSVAAAGPRIVDPQGELSAASAGFEPSVRSVAGHFLFLGRIPGLRRWFRPVQLPKGSSERWPDWVSGAAMLIRRDAFEQVGAFDESLFMYMEDVDLCRRLRAAGWSIRYEPAAVVEHDLGGSQGIEQAERWYVAFHGYLRRLHGAGPAMAASFIAALGLTARATYLRFRRPAHARRLAGAARTALRLALGRNVGTRDRPQVARPRILPR